MRMKLPKYTHAYTDRSGVKRYYVRRAGRKSIPLPGTVFSTEFMAAHAMALGGGNRAPKAIEQRPLRGSISQLIAAYMQSGEYLNLRESSRKPRYRMLQKVREQFGQVNIEAFTPQVAFMLLSKLTPANQFVWKIMFGSLFKYGINCGLCGSNPVEKFKPVRRTGDGHYTWTEDDIAKFRAFHPLGTQARLIMEIMLCCGCRISDALKLGPQHIRVNRQGEKEVFYRAKKNSADIDLLLEPELEEAIAAMGPARHLTFMVKASGGTYSVAPYSARFKKFCKAAGLPPQATAHGCRKGFSTRISNAGGSEHTIMAAIGDRSSAMARKYTEQRNRAHLAKEGQRAVRAMLRGGRV